MIYKNLRREGWMSEEEANRCCLRREMRLSITQAGVLVPSHIQITTTSNYGTPSTTSSTLAFSPATYRVNFEKLDLWYAAEMLKSWPDDEQAEQSE